MKAKNLFAAVLVALMAVAFSAPQVNAQENKETKEKAVRGPFLTNKFFDNWFVGIAGGLNAFGDGGYKAALGGTLDLNAGKWFLPQVAARVGYSGLTGSMWSPNPSLLGEELDADKGMYKQKFMYSYLHADALWDVLNTFCGYKETRLWSLIPYLHTGIMITTNRPGAQKFFDREFTTGLGLLNNIYLHKRVDLTLDVRGIFLSGKHHIASAGLSAGLQAMVGVSVNLGRTDWTRANDWHNPVDTDKIAAAEAAATALTAANEALAADKEKLTKENESLASEVAELKNRPVKAALEDVGPASVYFEIGQTTLSQKELQHLDYYLKNVLPNVGDKKVAVLTGSADSSTGTVRRNKYLSQKRVDYVLELLSQKYGIEADRFQVRTQVAEEGDASLNRAVVISFE